MNEQDLMGVLQMLFDQCADADEDDVGSGWPEDLVNCQTRTFEEEGLLTGNKGLVLELEDGSTFYMTIQEA